MTLPIDLVGAWRRSVPDFFYNEFAFAGLTTWEPPVITWNHLIDSNLEPAVDSNPITWADGVALASSASGLLTR